MIQNLFQLGGNLVEDLYQSGEIHFSPPCSKKVFKIIRAKYRSGKAALSRRGKLGSAAEVCFTARYKCSLKITSSIIACDCQHKNMKFLRIKGAGEIKKTLFNSQRLEKC